MISPLTELIKVHFRTFFREPGVLFWALLFPILMAWVLGLAFSESPELTKMVYVTDKSQSLDTLAGRAWRVPDLGSRVKIVFKKADQEEALRGIRRGEVNLYLDQENEKIIYHYDPVNTDALNTHLMVDRLLNKESFEDTEIRSITTQGNRYIDFLIPGLIALGIMNSCMWGIGYTLIDFRMKKLLRRMLATPMKRSDFMLSHLLFRVIISSVETALLLSFAVFWFDLKLQGSLAAFLLLFLAGIFCFSGLAVVVASRTRNSQVGNGLINAVILPMTILSGIFFSYHNFPEWAVKVIRYLPLTMLADSIRAVFNEGAGLAVQAVPVIVMSSIGFVCYLAGIRIFKWY